MAKVRQLILDVAGAAVDVLIFGETGTGKEMVARCLHDLSHPGQQNYVALNCGGMSDNLLDSELFGHEPGAFTGAQKRRIGKIEYASGGTLFLDEVESMPVNMQIKLLRVLQERVIERLGSNQQIPVSCRVVAASKDDLKLLSDQENSAPTSTTASTSCASNSRRYANGAKTSRPSTMNSCSTPPNATTARRHR
jgi:two-component system C4-dicarboxylate transport response regulator DctD